jgi:uncharacterized OB-fold protein
MKLFQCTECGRAYVAAPAFCRCARDKFAPVMASGRGRVYSCTTLYAAAEAHEKDLPFQIAIIELEEGARLTARITGPAVAIGDAVELAGESDGVYRFRAATT